MTVIKIYVNKRCLLWHKQEAKTGYIALVSSQSMRRAKFTSRPQIKQKGNFISNHGNLQEIIVIHRF